MFRRLQQQNPQLTKGVCQTLMKFLFYHAEMETFVVADKMSNIQTIQDYYRAQYDGGRHKQHLAQCEASYIKYVNGFEQSDKRSVDAQSSLMFPMRFLHGQPKTKADFQLLDRTVLFATMKKLGEGVDISSLHTVCLVSSLPASNKAPTSVKAQLEQVIGRLRFQEGQERRLFEFRDDAIQFYTRRWFARKKYYNSRGMQQHFL
jgi:hypothetical protein